MTAPGPTGEPALGLSKYLRTFRAAEGLFLEALLHERYLPVDPLLEAVLLALEPGPLPGAALHEAVRARGLSCSVHQLRSRLGMLSDFGLLIDRPDQDRLAFLAALDRALPAPAIDQVELTNVCPMRCAMCPRGNGSVNRPQGFMDVELFAEVVAQVAERQGEVTPLGLQNAGESLLHDNVTQMVACAGRAGVRTELSVNPVYLTLERYLALRDAGLGRLMISLDGVDAATLDAVRGPAARGAVALANLDRILEHRSERDEQAPALVIQMLRLSANQHQHTLFEEIYGALELPGVVAFLKDPDANTPPGLQAEGVVPQPQLCRAPWRTAVVLWDGKVVACCHDANGEAVLGDLREQSLSEIWESDAYEALREQVWSGKVGPTSPCARCAHLPARYRRPRLDAPPAEVLHW